MNEDTDRAEGESLVKYFEWQEQPGLRCQICLWDTLDGQKAMRDHMWYCPRCGDEYRRRGGA